MFLDHMKKVVETKLKCAELCNFTNRTYKDNVGGVWASPCELDRLCDVYLFRSFICLAGKEVIWLQLSFIDHKIKLPHWWAEQAQVLRDLSDWWAVRAQALSQLICGCAHVLDVRYMIDRSSKGLRFHPPGLSTGASYRGRPASLGSSLLLCLQWFPVWRRNTSMWNKKWSSSRLRSTAKSMTLTWPQSKSYMIMSLNP